MEFETTPIEETPETQEETELDLVRTAVNIAATAAAVVVTVRTVRYVRTRIAERRLEKAAQNLAVNLPTE